MKVYDEMRQALKDLRIDILKEKLDLLIDDIEEIDELEREKIRIEIERDEANDRIEELESELEDERTKFGVNESAEDQWKDDLWPQIKNKFTLTQLENLLK